MHFVAIVEQNKKEIMENDQKLAPADIHAPIYNQK